MNNTNKRLVISMTLYIMLSKRIQTQKGKYILHDSIYIGSKQVYLSNLW